MHGLPFVLLFVAMTFLSWGAYGPVLHRGTSAMGNDSLRAFVGVGLAYFIIAVIVPYLILRRTGEKGHWSILGTTYSIIAGAVGAFGALGVILALAYKGNPVYVMPIVFGFAPIVNTLVTAWMGNAFKQISGIFIAGVLAAACGAGGVLAFKPVVRHADSSSAHQPSHEPSHDTGTAAQPQEPTTPTETADAQPKSSPTEPSDSKVEPSNSKNDSGSTKSNDSAPASDSTQSAPAKSTAPITQPQSPLESPVAEKQVAEKAPAGAQPARNTSADIKPEQAAKAQQNSAPATSEPAAARTEPSNNPEPPPVANPPQLVPAQRTDSAGTSSVAAPQADNDSSEPPPVVNPPQLKQPDKVGLDNVGPDYGQAKRVRYVMVLADEASSTASAGSGPSSDVGQGNLMCIVLSIIMAAFCWGAYGPMLHQGQSRMGGSRLRPFICVGLAYFLIAVAAPMYLISSRAEVGQWTTAGLGWSIAAGAAGAVGALGIILAFNAGGKPFYVMPLVFGFAPVVNTFITLTLAGLWSQVEPRFWISLGVVIAGAITVLINAPKPKPHPATGAKH